MAGDSIPPPASRRLPGGHEKEVTAVYDSLNVVFQALGTNAKTGGGCRKATGFRSCGWRSNITPLTRKFYAPDFHAARYRASHRRGLSSTGHPGILRLSGPGSFKKGPVRHEREGVARFAPHFSPPHTPRRSCRGICNAETPPETAATRRVRARLNDGIWSDWLPSTEASASSPRRPQLEIEIHLRTNDGFVTPKVQTPRVQWD